MTSADADTENVPPGTKGPGGKRPTSSKGKGGGKTIKTKGVSYYDVLNVQTGCTVGTVRKAYRRLVLSEHPDKGGSDERFQLLQQAYEVMSVPDKRREHDAELQRARSNQLKRADDARRERRHAANMEKMQKEIAKAEQAMDRMAKAMGTAAAAAGTAAGNRGQYYAAAMGGMEKVNPDQAASSAAAAAAGPARTESGRATIPEDANTSVFSTSTSQARRGPREGKGGGEGRKGRGRGRESREVLHHFQITSLTPFCPEGRGRTEHIGIAGGWCDGQR
jgi:curved DNA-binding protein CbpA